MASQGSQIFNTRELLGMEEIHDKLIWIGVAHLTSTKQCYIRSFFVSSERSLLDLNDTLWCALVLIHNFELDFTFKNIEFLYLLFFYIVILFWFSTYFFDNIKLCTNPQNVTLSNMSHSVYITIFGEIDGVTLSMLDCISILDILGMFFCFIFLLFLSFFVWHSRKWISQHFRQLHN